MPKFMPWLIQILKLLKLVKPIIDYFKAEPHTAIIQPKLLDFKNKTYFEYAAGGYIDKYGYPYCRGRMFDTVEKILVNMIPI
jgi:hypothetical protein